jgi:hypothetical protein
MCYLADTRDAQHRLLPQTVAKRGEVLSWLFFQTVSVPLAYPVLEWSAYAAFLLSKRMRNSALPCKW